MQQIFSAQSGGQVHQSRHNVYIKSNIIVRMEERTN